MEHASAVHLAKKLLCRRLVLCTHRTRDPVLLSRLIGTASDHIYLILKRSNGVCPTSAHSCGERRQQKCSQAQYKTVTKEISH